MSLTRNDMLYWPIACRASATRPRAAEDQSCQHQNQEHSGNTCSSTMGVTPLPATAMLRVMPLTSIRVYVTGDDVVGNVAPLIANNKRPQNATCNGTVDSCGMVAVLQVRAIFPRRTWQG